MRITVIPAALRHVGSAGQAGAERGQEPVDCVLVKSAGHHGVLEGRWEQPPSGARAVVMRKPALRPLLHGRVWFSCLHCRLHRSSTRKVKRSRTPALLCARRESFPSTQNRPDAGRPANSPRGAASSRPVSEPSPSVAVTVTVTGPAVAGPNCRTASPT